MHFEPALWDGSNPLYAPCTGVSDGNVYWKAPAKYRKAGYSLKSKRLIGKANDGLDHERAAQARELTREMLQWYEGAEMKLAPGTWGALIARYKSDDISPMQSVQPNTRQSYLDNLTYWEGALANEPVADMTFEEVKKIERAMIAKGRSRHFIKAKFTMLRMVVSYGVAVRYPGARDVKEVISELRVKSPKARTSAPTESQILSIIAAADKAGDSAFALGTLIQWRIALRAMDVRGDYFRLAKGEDRSGICRGNFRWGKGLTWDMINGSTMTKVPSKTDESLPDAIHWDLSLVPDLLDRLNAVPAERRVGPVIVDENGMPFDRYAWAKRWRKYSAEAGVPSSVRSMDTRAGAITDARNKGADPLSLQQQANHANFKTTQRYIRNGSEGANNVLRLRQERT